VNAFFGERAGYKNSTARNNSFFGAYSGDENNSSIGGNTLIGSRSGEENVQGNRNTYLGVSSGRFSGNGSNNVFIGAYSGYNETGSYKLYIDSEYAGTSTPLIYGEFDNDLIRINGTLHITETAKLEPRASPPSTCTSTVEYGLIYYDNSATQHVLKVCTNTGWKNMN